MRNGTKFGTHACSHSNVISHSGLKSNLMKHSYFYLGAVQKGRRQLGGRGVKNWTKLPTDSTKKMLIWDSGFQKFGKFADFTYGWLLTPLDFQFSQDTFLSCYPLSVQGELLNSIQNNTIFYLSSSKVYLDYLINLRDLIDFLRL